MTNPNADNSAQTPNELETTCDFAATTGETSDLIAELCSHIVEVKHARETERAGLCLRLCSAYEEAREQRELAARRGDEIDALIRLLDDVNVTVDMVSYGSDYELYNRLKSERDGVGAGA